MKVVHVFPRRRKGQGPVSVTLELLETCAGIPLYKAAEKIGICETALKSACRKLGVLKWESMKNVRSCMVIKSIYCEASRDAECDAACDASCDAECKAECDGDAPECNAECDASFSPDKFFI